MTARQKAPRAFVAVGLILALSVPVAHAQTSTTGADETVTTAVAPGDTAPNGGPLLVPGEPDTSSSSATAEENSDNTGTVVALVISGLLVVALLLALLTYWFWRNTRPQRPVAGPALEAEG